MNTDRIKQYIEFAIENGFNMREYLLKDWQIKKWKEVWLEATATISDIELITSKPFIEAVARGVWKEAPYWKSKWIKVKMRFPWVWQLNYEEQDELYEDITHFQAFAIRDNALEDFIDLLLNK